MRVNENREFRAIRLALNLTQEQAGVLLGKSRRAIQYNETEGHEVDYAALTLMKTVGLLSQAEQANVYRSALKRNG